MGWLHRNFAKMISAGKLEWLDDQVEENMMIMLSSFDAIPERDKRTDGRTDGRNCYQYIASALLSSSSRMRVMNHNWSTTKQRLHPQSVATISRHSVLSGDRIRRCGTWSGSRHKDTIFVSYDDWWPRVLHRCAACLEHFAIRRHCVWDTYLQRRLKTYFLPRHSLNFSKLRTSDFILYFDFEKCSWSNL